MHCVQLLAPVVEPVIEPAAHSMHDALYDTVEYVPIGHAVHVRCGQLGAPELKRATLR